MARETCKFRGIVVKDCGKPAEPGAEYCFWHSNKQKLKSDIDKARNACENLEGAIFADPKLEKADFGNLKLVEARFSGHGTLKGADFSRADLWITQFRGSPDALLDLSQAKFDDANLQGTLFEYVKLDGASFDNAVVEGANFRHASMKDIKLGNARSLNHLLFDDVTWDKKYVNRYEREGDLATAQRLHKALKQAYTGQGELMIAGQLFYREMECRRKSARTLKERLTYLLFWAIWGYGERPWRVIITGIALILFFAGIYSLINRSFSFLYYLYFSAISFTALGYGEWVAPPPSVVQALSTLEVVLGLVLNGSFLITLTRKMIR